MLNQHSHLAELDRLQRQANALRRSLNGLRNGTRNVLQLAAQLDDHIAELRTAITQPEQEAQHAHEDIRETVAQIEVRS